MKTIFITLSMMAVSRNLFFFPGSVFDRLKRILNGRRDLRLVVIVPDKDFRKYDRIFAADWNEQCILEPISVSYPKSFLQKIFFFFYSYFIYTGTTKQLATLGVRPDEPPAGGPFKKYLSPLKFLIANTFGKIKVLKHRILPLFYHKVFRERPFQELFNKYKPDLIFISHIYGRLDTELLAEADRRGVKTLGMASNWDHFDKYYLPFKVDTLLAQSDQVRDFAVRFQEYNPKKIHLIGYPHFDFIASREYAWERSRLLSSLNFPEDAKYILYVSGSAYCPDEPDIIEKILDWIDKGKFGQDVRLVIRPYIGGRGKDREFDEEKYNRFESHPKVAFYRREFWGDFEKSMHFINIMRHADIVISIYSTIVIEAAVLDRPLVGIGFDGYKKRPFSRSINRFAIREHFKDVLNSGAVRTAANFESLFIALNNYLEKPELDRDKRESLRQRICYKLDGKSSERIVEHIINGLK